MLLLRAWQVCPFLLFLFDIDTGISRGSGSTLVSINEVNLLTSGPVSARVRTNPAAVMSSSVM